MNPTIPYMRYVSGVAGGIIPEPLKINGILRYWNKLVSHLRTAHQIMIGSANPASQNHWRPKYIWPMENIRFGPITE
jgi:hypothetical protein